jgi:ubiquinone/menaquinone biosynthesis C-methylase UbiE
MMPAAMAADRRVDYDDHQHRVYSRGRELVPRNAATWAAVLARHVAPGAAVADIGAGTGHYSRLLAEALEADVVGVEPSARMRQIAARQSAHPRVRYVAGRAEALPLADASRDVALFSNVLHHVEDRTACAAELRRVIRPGGLVLTRGMLPENVPELPFVRFFPESLPIAARQVADAVAAVEAILAAGFERIAQDAVVHLVADDMGAYADKLALRAISTLELIDDGAFARGLERARAAAAQEAEARPVLETMHMRVLRRRA